MTREKFRLLSAHVTPAAAPSGGDDRPNDLSLDHGRPAGTKSRRGVSVDVVTALVSGWIRWRWIGGVARQVQCGNIGPFAIWRAVFRPALRRRYKLARVSYSNLHVW